MHRSLISAAVLALAALASTPALAGPAGAVQNQTTTQLPRSVRPTHYDVAITPNAAASTFAATVAIELDVLTPTASITLNAADLRFTSAQLRGASGAPQSAKITLDAAAQTATFHFARALAKGHYTLALDYSGVIGTQAVGLFSLDYDTPAGRKRALYTQFENSDARRVIPSWDEPGYKASFSLTATVADADLAVSNMPITSKRALPDGRSVVTFADTPKMSTYLLFFSVGQFERVSATVDGTELGVVTQKGASAQAAFALDASKAILREYNDYFGVKYPLPKLDNVAAPGRSQFFSAMENWGAIFTFEYAMLLDPSVATQGDKERIFETVAHEAAHQWFGDLVTMRWWDDLWLNEGFASWMESRTTARLHPEWNTGLGIVDVREEAIGRDSINTTHPVVQHVATVEQASQAFDSITYKKGEAVIRMLENYVGEDAWRAGVRNYMQAHGYGNTSSDDLWRQIEKAAGKPIMAIAHDFTLQSGVPMIRVDALSCTAGNAVVTLSQGEFSRDVPNKKTLSWRVPVIAQSSTSSQQVRTLVAGGKATVSVPGCGPVLVNAGQTGYFRTLYAPGAFAPLAAKFATLAPVDQLGLLTDSWALGLAGLQPMSDFLDLAKATPATADPQVWGKVAGLFDALHNYYKKDPVRQAQFDRFAHVRLTPVLAQLGWSARAGEADSVANLRETLINALSDMGEPSTLAEARRRYAAQASEPGAVPPALKMTILGVIAAHANASDWDALRKLAQNEQSPMIKDQLYEMLASCYDPALAKRALELALTDEPGATNGAGMIVRVANEHPELAFEFALSHYEQVSQRVDATSSSRYFPRLASGSFEPTMIAKVKQYASQHLAASARRDADTAIASIKDRVKVCTERLPAVDNWLAHNAQ